jgi:hypothetical protein
MVTRRAARYHCFHLIQNEFFDCKPFYPISASKQITGCLGSGMATTEGDRRARRNTYG